MKCETCDNGRSLEGGRWVRCSDCDGTGEQSTPVVRLVGGDDATGTLEERHRGGGVSDRDNPPPTHGGGVGR